jgi:hypothetical protein
MNPARTLGPALIMNNTGQIIKKSFLSCNPRNIVTRISSLTLLHSIKNLLHDSWVQDLIYCLEKSMEKFPPDIIKDTIFPGGIYCIGTAATQ